MKNENFSHLELLTVQQRKESEAAEAGDVYLPIIHCSKKRKKECSYFERCSLSSLRVSMSWNILSPSLSDFVLRFDLRCERTIRRVSACTRER